MNQWQGPPQHWPQPQQFYYPYVTPEQKRERKAQSSLSLWAVFLIIAGAIGAFGAFTQIMFANTPPVRENYYRTEYYGPGGGHMYSSDSKSSSNDVPELAAYSLELRDQAMKRPQLWLLVLTEVLLAVMAIGAGIRMLKHRSSGISLVKWRVLIVLLVYLPLLAWFTYSTCIQTITFHERAEAYMGLEGGGLLIPTGDPDKPPDMDAALPNVDIGKYFKIVYIVGFTFIVTPVLVFNLVVYLAVRRKFLREFMDAKQLAASKPPPTSAPAA